MATQSAERRNRTLVALMGGFVVFAGLGLGLSAPALADDDDWHTEADRPVAPEQQLKDKAEIQSVATKPSREQIYASPATMWVTPTLHATPSAFQTATVDRPQH